MSERAPHWTGTAPRIRNEEGQLETRSATLRIRIEPSLLARARKAASDDAPDYHRYNQRGQLSDWIRTLIDAELARRNSLHSAPAEPDPRQKDLP